MSRASTQALVRLVAEQKAALFVKDAELEFGNAALDTWLAALEAFSTADESLSVRDIPLAPFLQVVMEETLHFRLKQLDRTEAEKIWRTTAAKLERILLESSISLARARSLRSRSLVRSCAAAANEDPATPEPFGP